jgi:hypothetical protein
MGKRMMLYVVAGLVLILCAGLSGCKAGASKEPVGFASNELMSKLEDLPFQNAWIKPGFNKAGYKKVYIAPVNTDYLMEQDWWKESMRHGKMLKDVQDVALFTQETFINAFKEDPNHRFKVVKEPGDKTLIVEIAITELTPNKPFLKIATFAPFAGAVVALLNSSNLSTVAFEMRIRDGATGEVVAMCADREQEKMYIATKKHFTWYAHAHQIIKEWAAQFVELANRQPGEIVTDTKAFELQPWK